MRPRPLVSGLVALLAMMALVSGAALAAEPKRGGTLRVSYGNDIANLDFHTAPGYEMMWVAMNVGCGLVNITPDGKFTGDAAESWQISPDGLPTPSSSGPTSSSTTAPRSTPRPSSSASTG
jgi:ABC-type transport system substrate-binding protein